MQSLDEIFIQQRNLALYCRTGEFHPLINTIEGRVHHYRRLVFNNIDDSLATAYPLTRQLLQEDEWELLTHNFFSRVACSSPMVWKMPLELYAYVEKHETELTDKYPQLLDLLRFEWIEVELFMMADKDSWRFSADGDLLNDVLCINPEHHIERLIYPVHTRKADEIYAAHKGNYFVLGYRHPDTGEVNFMDVSPVYVWLIESLKTTENNLVGLCEEAACTFNIDKDAVLANVTPFFNALLEKKFITIKK